MAVRIRLTRVGATKQPTYRVVVADSRPPVTAAPSTRIGHYNPRSGAHRAEHRRGKGQGLARQGAQPSDTVARLLRRAGVLPAAK